VSSKYEFIDGEKANYPIIKMCAWSQVSRSGFYEWRDRPLSATAERRAALAVRIVEIFEAFRQTYGYRRVHAQLGHEGIEASPELVRQIMGDEGLEACQPRPWRITTTTADGSGGPADLIGRDFTAPVPGVRFVGDVTYVRTWAGWVYLATVIDLCTKEVVGWSMADHMRTSLVCDAVSMASRNGRIRPGAVFHSDRGAQYTSAEFADHLSSLGMSGSMGRTGVCWDNALAESFFSMLKNELVYRTVFSTRHRAMDAIAEYIEVFYNRQRLHSGLGYRTPSQVRDEYAERQAA
jgi:transposase InsO family protein